MKIKDALIDKRISYDEFYSMLQEKGIGNWDNINSTEIIRDYIKEMMRQGVTVSHILVALEQEESQFDDWSIWLGNSMESPSPINSKQDLVEALNLSDEEMENVF